MSIDRTSEILSAYADQLNRGGALSADLAESMALEQRATINALIKTATRAKRALVPVTIAPAFRARLREGLTMAAHHKESQSILLGHREPTWGWVIGAAALGSAAGLIAIAWRARQTRRGSETAAIAPKSEKLQVGN